MEKEIKSHNIKSVKSKVIWNVSLTACCLRSSHAFLTPMFLMPEDVTWASGGQGSPVHRHVTGDRETLGRQIPQAGSGCHAVSLWFDFFVSHFTINLNTDRRKERLPLQFPLENLLQRENNEPPQAGPGGTSGIGGGESMFFWERWRPPQP